MGIADLTGPRAKLGRADEHLNVFDSEFRTFALQDSNPVGFTHRREEAWYVVYMDPPPIPPMRLALIAGDCLNNLREVLDHLVWQLVLREDKEPRNTHCFPLYESGQKFLDEVKAPPKKKYKRSALHGLQINGDAWAIIEGAQPFQSAKPQDHALSLLAQFTNVNKHRTLLVRRVIPDEKTLMACIEWEPDLQPIERQFVLSYLSTEHPTEVARFRFAENVDPGMYVKGELRLGPTFGDGKTQTSFDFLRGVRKSVQSIFNQVATLPRVQG